MQQEQAALWEIEGMDAEQQLMEAAGDLADAGDLEEAFDALQRQGAEDVLPEGMSHQRLLQGAITTPMLVVNWGVGFQQLLTSGMLAPAAVLPWVRAAVPQARVYNNTKEFDEEMFMGDMEWKEKALGSALGA